MNNEIKSLNEFLDRLILKPEVEAVCLLGGMGKQKDNHIIDKYSDFDISIFINSKSLPLWLPDFSFYLLIDGKVSSRVMNIYQSRVEDLLQKNILWSHSKCEAYVYAEFVFDRYDRVEKAVKKIITNSNNIKSKLCKNIHLIKRFSEKNPEKMIFRNQLLALDVLLNEAIKLLFECVYLVNDKFVPHLKWIEHDLKTLNWLPNHFEKNITKGLSITGTSPDNLLYKAKIINEICQEIYNHEKNNLPSNLYSFICNKVDTDRQLLLNTTTEVLSKTCKTNNIALLRSYVNTNLLDLQSFDYNKFCDDTGSSWV